MILVVAVVLVVNLACVMAVFSLVESGTATPQIYISGFDYSNNGDTSFSYVSVKGTVVNPSSMGANNVNVSVYVYYDKYGLVQVNSTTVNLDSIPGGSSKSFDVDMSYPGGDYYDFVNGYYFADYNIIMSSRFDFGTSFFVVVLPIAVLMPVLDVYSAYRLGLFGWITARKKESEVTLGWSAAVAVVVIVEYWLYYSSHHGLFISYFTMYPALHLWDWILIFFISIIAGAFIADLEIAVYSFLASLLLSFVVEFIYGSFFIWFGLGISGSFSTTSPGLAFTMYLQTVLQQVFLGLLRMVNIEIPCFLILGVFIGAFVRSYFEPTIDVS